MFEFLKKSNANTQKISKVAKSSIHRFTEKEDLTLIKGIVGGKTYREIARKMGLSRSQLQNRVIRLGHQGLTLSRLNNTQEVVAVNVLKTNLFSNKFKREIEKLANKSVKKEIAHIKKGNVKTIFKTWTLAELNTMKFYGNTKSVNEYAEMFNRPISAVQTKLIELGL